MNTDRDSKQLSLDNDGSAHIPLEPEAGLHLSTYPDEYVFMVQRHVKKCQEILTKPNVPERAINAAKKYIEEHKRVHSLIYKAVTD